MGSNVPPNYQFSIMLATVKYRSGLGVATGYSALMICRDKIRLIKATGRQLIAQVYHISFVIRFVAEPRR